MERGEVKFVCFDIQMPHTFLLQELQEPFVWFSIVDDEDLIVWVGCFFADAPDTGLEEIRTVLCRDENGDPFGKVLWFKLKGV
ncbi:hypothetical protein A2635_02940 [Candidatus Peribacteria bacterium RIFCSPHIGHO2_01_FULL_51_9]|nr:MAG: hypothetical protein A2635_02940 [Candidatus Peribacteria bacterium RIFCSPHIGHO2_01_FULL_51_9]